VTLAARASPIAVGKRAGQRDSEERGGAVIVALLPRVAARDDQVAEVVGQVGGGAHDRPMLTRVSDREPIPWKQNRRRDLEAVMADEVPGLQWRVRAMSSGKGFGNAFMVSTDIGVYRVVRELTKETARRLAHELALAVRLRDG
jgi:hypothetical protein